MRTISTGDNGVYGQPTIKVLDNYWSVNGNETGMEIQETVRTQTVHTGAPTDIKRTRARLHLRALFLTLTFIQRLARIMRCEERQTGKNLQKRSALGASAVSPLNS